METELLKPVPAIVPKKSAKKTKEMKEAEKENKEVLEENPLEAAFKESAKNNRYFEAIGRRKTARARIRMFTQGDKVFLVNDMPYQKYFSTFELAQTADSALRKMKCLDRFRVLAKLSGGGIHAQAEAVRHATARALVDFNIDFKKRLRRAGYLTRDPRQRERKKFGLKRARKAPQWQKR